MKHSSSWHSWLSSVDGSVKSSVQCLNALHPRNFGRIQVEVSLLDLYNFESWLVLYLVWLTDLVRRSNLAPYHDLRSIFRVTRKIEILDTKNWDDLLLVVSALQCASKFDATVDILQPEKGPIFCTLHCSALDSNSRVHYEIRENL